MPKEDFVLLFKITYYCALRISETINLTAGDFHLDKKILILKNTKTGKLLSAEAGLAEVTRSMNEANKEVKELKVYLVEIALLLNYSGHHGNLYSIVKDKIENPA